MHLKIKENLWQFRLPLIIIVAISLTQGTFYNYAIQQKPDCLVNGEFAICNDKVEVVVYKHLDSTAFQEIQNWEAGWIPDCIVSCHGIHWTYTTHNKITNVGINFVQDQIFGRASTTPAIQTIALSTDSTTPAFTDTTCPSQITTNGLQQASGTLTIGTASAGASSTTLSNTFTSTGTFTGVTKACFWTSSSDQTLFADTLFTSTPLISGDQLQITETISITYL